MNKADLDLPDRNAICAAFDREAGRYDQYAALEREVGSRLMDRLEFQRRSPGVIIDLGSGTGFFSAALKRRFRKAEVIGLDVSMAMSQAFCRRSGFLHPLRGICADFSLLPIADRSADLLFSNLALQWTSDFRQICGEFRRVLRPGGMLLFSSLGPDSLNELRSAAGHGPASPRTRQFADMHDIGDALLSAGFAEPVMDSELITTKFGSLDALMTELEVTGASTHFSEWNARIQPSAEIVRAYQAFRQDGHYPVSWEIIYGTAFGPDEGQPIKTREGDVAAFSVESLRRSIRRK